MSSTITAIAVIALLVIWHARNRRHPGWCASSDGRSHIYCGYALVMIASYWLVSAPTGTTWEWALGNAWLLAAMVAFVAGFENLNRATAQRDELARLMETLAPTTDSISR
ncbi:hypothetical protein JDV09_20400 [Mycobacterium sp. Y57]|uniref:hypothetical protein n=1 Tax=Mycolicibacterium xanthum TaxID=2796469 RepID=UPI001C851843|nr:hypothetical protein [Mycolicibacterium xanthum]MBX7434441.1 hypothetical protein [Mycolicibacterium xanthum]